MALAIKPTRREIIHAVLGVAHKVRQREIEELQEEGKRIYRAAQAANAKVNEIAKEYATKKYKSLHARLKKLIGTEFPDVEVFFTVDIEKEANANKFKSQGKANIRLVVKDVEVRELSLPGEVRAEMVAASTEADRLFKEYDDNHRLVAAKQRAETLGYGGGSSSDDFRQLLQQIIPKLGDEATPHLDALAKMVEKALTVNTPVED